VRNVHARAVSSLGGTITSPTGGGIAAFAEKMDRKTGLISEGVGNLMGAIAMNQKQPKRVASVLGDSAQN
jgi:hypothetical protein